MQPEEWFGLNPTDGEDSVEEIDSSDEGEEEEEEGEDGSNIDMPEVGADGQPQPDRASSNEPRTEVPPATGGVQVGADLPPVPPTDATDSVLQHSNAPPAVGDPSAQTEPPAAPGGAADSNVQSEPLATQPAPASRSLLPRQPAPPSRSLLLLLRIFSAFCLLL